MKLPAAPSEEDNAYLFNSVMTRIKIDFAYPPSVNRAWRHKRLKTGRLVVYKDAKYVHAQQQFGFQWLMQKPRGFKTIDAPFRAVLVLGKPLKRRGDIDNKWKFTLDSAQKAGIISNDSLCREQTARFGEPEEAPEGARLIIEVL